MAQSSVQDKNPLPLVRDYSLAQSLIWEGKAFHVSNVTAQTIIVGQTSVALTLATVYLGNRGSKKMVPLWAKFAQGGTVAGGRIFWNVKTADTDQYTSGTALTVNALNRHYRAGSQVTAAHTATIPTFTAGNALTLSSGSAFQSVTVANAGDPLDMFPFPGCCVVNPGGALYLYSNADTTGPGWEFDIAWAELEV